MRTAITCDLGCYLNKGDRIIYRRMHPLKKKVYRIQGEVAAVCDHFILVQTRCYKTCIPRIPTVFESITIREEAADCRVG